MKRLAMTAALACLLTVGFVLSFSASANVPGAYSNIEWTDVILENIDMSTEGTVSHSNRATIGDRAHMSAYSNMLVGTYPSLESYDMQPASFHPDYFNGPSAFPWDPYLVFEAKGTLPTFQYGNEYMKLEAGIYTIPLIIPVSSNTSQATQAQSTDKYGIYAVSVNGKQQPYEMYYISLQLDSSAGGVTYQCAFLLVYANMPDMNGGSSFNIQVQMQWANVVMQTDSYINAYLPRNIRMTAPASYNASGDIAALIAAINSQTQSIRNDLTNQNAVIEQQTTEMQDYFSGLYSTDAGFNSSSGSLSANTGEIRDIFSGSFDDAKLALDNAFNGIDLNFLTKMAASGSFISSIFNGFLTEMGEYRFLIYLPLVLALAMIVIGMAIQTIKLDGVMRMRDESRTRQIAMRGNKGSSNAKGNLKSFESGKKEMSRLSK